MVFLGVGAVLAMPVELTSAMDPLQKRKDVPKIGYALLRNEAVSNTANLNLRE